MSEIPATWTALAAGHPCLANPWGDGCPNPPKQVTFPSQTRLAQTEAIRSGSVFAPPSVASSTVKDAGGASLQVAARPTSPDAVAAAEVGTCDLDVGVPEIVAYGSNYLARGQADVSCPVNYIEGNVTTDLYRSGTLLATDYDESFTSPIYALASAIYDCNHQTAYPYSNTGLGYVENIYGSAATNTATGYANHTCPG